MINAARCRAKSSPSGGAVIPACRRRPGPSGPPYGGVARGAAPGSRVGGGDGGMGFAVRPPLPSCRVKYASVVTSQTLGVTDQYLRLSEAWLGNRRCFVGVIRAVVAGPPPQAHRCSWGRGGILLGHGVAPGGARYNDRLEESVVCTVFVEGGCGCGGGVSRYHYFF